MNKYRRPENRPLNKLTDRQLVDMLMLNVHMYYSGEYLDIMKELNSRGIAKTALKSLNER